MSRILRRPMFRGGGKVSSYGNGIATGLAGGGRVNLNIGGSPFGAPIIKVPQATPPVTGGNILNKNVGRMSGMASKGANLLKSPAFSEAGIMQGLKKLPALGDKIAKYGTNLIKRFPAISYGLAGEYVTRPQDVDKAIYEQEGYGPIEGRIRQILDPTYMSKMKKVYEQGYNEDGELNAIINKQITDKDDKEKDAAAAATGKDTTVDINTGEPVESRKDRLKRTAKEYQDILGEGIKKDSIFDAMIEGGTRLYAGEGAAASIRAANTKLDPIQNIKTASRKLALEEDIAMRKAMAVSAGKSTEMSRRIAAMRAAGRTPEQIADMVAGIKPETLGEKVSKLGKVDGYAEFIKENRTDVEVVTSKVDISKKPKGKYYIADKFIIVEIDENGKKISEEVIKNS